MALTMNDYQEKAMTTCLPSCDNMVYALTELNAEVGEFNDKVAKWVRKGICRIENNNLVFNTADEVETNAYRLELIKELGDIQWSVALLSKLLGYTMGDMGDLNLDKLRDRAERNVIIGEGDNR